MARTRGGHITTALTSLLPRRPIRALAGKLGVVQRRRKLDIVALVYSLVLGFSVGERRTLSGLRRAYFRATGIRLAPSSFHARFTASLIELMRTLTLQALEGLARRRPKLHGVFAPFVEVLAVDSAVLRLSNALEAVYPSVFRHYMKASAKLTVVMNVIGRGAKTIKLSPGSRRDTHLLQAGAWMKGRLLIFDLGFFRTIVFREIDDHGGYFLSRARKHANPIITRCHQRGHSPLVGMKLKPPSIMPPEYFTAVYAARWEVELLFRELKQSYRLEHMPSGNKHVTETLIYAALLTLIVSRRLFMALSTRWRPHTIAPRSMGGAARHRGMRAARSRTSSSRPCSPRTVGFPPPWRVARASVADPAPTP